MGDLLALVGFCAVTVAVGNAAWWVVAWLLVRGWRLVRHG